LTGADGGDYIVDCSQGGRIEKEYSSIRQPTIEIIGDAKRIKAIFEGKKDARKQFLAGGIRVRGDLRYLSDMLLELGILTEPL
jgi:putative sterol carrier protein